MKKIRWGVLSTGKIAHTFAKALQAVEGAELYAVSSRSAEKAAAFAKQYGFEKSFGSAAEMLADPNVDVVYICSPMSCHYADSLACLNAGKKVLCEKTLTLNGNQLDEILELAGRKNLFFMEAMWMKCLTAFLQAKKWVEEGRIGRVKLIKADFLSLCEDDSENRLFRNDLGGGALLDLGVYPITLAMSILGNFPEKISAVGVMKNGVDYDTMITLRYSSGAAAALACAFDCKGDNGAYIIGENGMISLENWFFCEQTARLYDSGNRLVEEKYFPHKPNGYEHEIIEVNRCLNEGLLQSPLVPQHESRCVMTVIDEVKRQLGLKFDGEK